MNQNDSLTGPRLEKLAALRAADTPPYPDSFHYTHTCNQAYEASPDTPVSVYGRVVSRRVMGRAAFAHIQDITGKVQIYIRQDRVGAPLFSRFTDQGDLGDIICCTGKMFRTKTGENTVAIETFQVLAKGLWPLPDKHAGLGDDRTRYTQRYLEIISDPSVAERFRARHRTVKAIRRFLDESAFEEVETPILQPQASGANAKAFETHHDKLDATMFLRIAPETYLKRLLVAGFPRVYEIGRCFRNEGMSRQHLQEFTMLEFYAAGWNMEINMAFTERLIRSVLLEVLGKLQVQSGDVCWDFEPAWPVVCYVDRVQADSGINVLEYDTAESLIAEIRRRNISIGPTEGLGLGTLIDKLYKTVTRPKLTQPTFVTHYPAALSPLARPNTKDPRIADQFQLLVGGAEICKGYSELVDPQLQREKLTEQAREHDLGDEEAMEVDEAYLTAMEYGMPPNSGLGMGIDRLTAVLTGLTNLKETVIFPIGF